MSAMQKKLSRLRQDPSQIHGSVVDYVGCCLTSLHLRSMNLRTGCDARHSRRSLRWESRHPNRHGKGRSRRLDARVHPGSYVEASLRLGTEGLQLVRGGCTPLMLAIIGRQLEAAERLLLLGADAGLENDDGWTAAH